MLATKCNVSFGTAATPQADARLRSARWSPAHAALSALALAVLLVITGNWAPSHAARVWHTSGAVVVSAVGRVPGSHLHRTSQASPHLGTLSYHQSAGVAGAAPRTQPWLVNVGAPAQVRGDPVAHLLRIHSGAVLLVLAALGATAAALRTVLVTPLASGDSNVAFACLAVTRGMVQRTIVVVGAHGALGQLVTEALGRGTGHEAEDEDKASVGAARLLSVAPGVRVLSFSGAAEALEACAGADGVVLCAEEVSLADAQV